MKKFKTASKEELLSHLNNKDSWNSLSLADKSNMIETAIRNGIDNLEDIREKYNEFAEGGKLYGGGGFTSELDWTPESWFSKRVPKPDGTFYNEDEAARLASHVPEYYNIEQTAKQNGTWLKMPDGSTWEGDPRSWVMMQSSAYKENYSPKPWYTGQAEWPTKFDYGQGEVTTNKVTRAPYYNNQMWFSDEKDYGQTFADYQNSTGLGWRFDTPGEEDIKGHNFLSAIPKEGNYRILESSANGNPDQWQRLPFVLENNSINRLPEDQIYVDSKGRNVRSDKQKVLTDDVVNWSKDLGDQGIFMQNIDDGAIIKDGGIYRKPVNEFISQPGFTDKVKFIEGNTGDFNIDDPYKYANNIYSVFNPFALNMTAYGGPLNYPVLNKYSKGGNTDWDYNSWKSLISKHLGINIDEDNTYDYEGYFKKYPIEAWKMLKGNPDAHFTDEFKTVYHPTFSSASLNNDGSIYSGVKHPIYNPQGLKGGTWSPDFKEFTMSNDGYKGPVGMDDRAWYLMNNENNGVVLRESDGTLPLFDGIPWAGVLPNVTITGRKHSIGGPLNYPILNEFAGGGNTKQEYIYDVLPRLLREAGLDIRVSSGYRPAGKVGTAGKRSWHWRHGAVDIVPQGKTTFEDIEKAIYTNPAIYNYMLSNNFGLLDESGRTAESRATMKRTGATGAHFHFGKDSSPAARYRQRMSGYLAQTPAPAVPTPVPTSISAPVPGSVLMNPQAPYPMDVTALNPQVTVAEVPEQMTTPEQTAVRESPYSPEALARAEKAEGMRALSMLLGMSNSSGVNTSSINALRLLAGTDASSGYPDDYGYRMFAEGGSTSDDDLIDWIIREEGFSEKPEDIGDGKMTLGSGLTAKKWLELYKKRGNKWSDSDNRMAVREEVANRRRWAEANIPNWDTLSTNAQKALLSYKYNYDFNKSNSPKLFQALAANNLEEAAKQMDATSKNPKFKKGLQARRQREQEWFLSDVAAPQITTAPSTSAGSIKPIVGYTEPASSTVVYNPYRQQAENTQILPIMIPDKTRYVVTEEMSPSLQRAENIKKAFEARRFYNTVMNTNSLENTTSPQFKSIFADGGNLYGGTNTTSTYPTQQMQIGLNVQGWPNYSLEEIVANGERIEQQRQAMQEAFAKRLDDYFTESNDATAVADGRPQNQHLRERAIEGAKSHAAWEKEHPNLTKWGYVAPFIPLAIATGPAALGAIGTGMSALGDAVLGTSLGQAATSTLAPVTTAAMTEYGGAPGWMWAEQILNSVFAGHGLSTAIEEGGVSPITALELLPLGQAGVQGTKMAYNSAKPYVNQAVETLQNNYPALFDPYTSWDATLGYYGDNIFSRAIGTMGRRYGYTPKAGVPEFHRRLRIEKPEEMLLDENGNMIISSGRTGLGHDNITNFATSEAARGHSKHKGLSGIDDYIIDSRAIGTQDFKSIQPSDTFFESGKLSIDPKSITLVSGNTEMLDYAKSLGMKTLSSPRLRQYYSMNHDPEITTGILGRFGIPKYGAAVGPGRVGDEIQRLTTMRGAPTMQDYSYFENITGLNSGVVPASRYTGENGAELFGRWGKVRMEPIFNHVAYDPATSIETIYREAKIGKRPWSDYYETLEKMPSAIQQLGLNATQ